MYKRKLVITIILLIIFGWKFTPEVFGQDCYCGPCDYGWYQCDLSAGWNCPPNCQNHQYCSNCDYGIRCTCNKMVCNCSGNTCPPTSSYEKPIEPPFEWPTEPPPTEPPYYPTATPKLTWTPTPVLPTSTPAPPTITPIPPTSTPIPPTSTPVPTATPTLPPSCNCDSIDYAGDLAPGKTVTFTTYAKVVNPDSNPSKVLNMVYHLEANGTEIAKSNELTPTSLGKMTDPKTGKLIERYKTTWVYTIPSSGSGEVAYHVWVQINCAYKTAQVSNKTVMVLAASTTGNQSFFSVLLDFFSNLFGTTGTTPTPTPTSIPTPSPTPRFAPPFVIEAVPTGRTIQLGTFFPTVRIQKACKEVWFWITY